MLTASDPVQHSGENMSLSFNERWKLQRQEKSVLMSQNHVFLLRRKQAGQKVEDDTEIGENDEDREEKMKKKREGQF